MAKAQIPILNISILVIFFMVGIAGATTLDRGISPQIETENSAEYEEIYRIKIDNRVGGVVEVSGDKGKVWEPSGKVVYPTARVSKTGYSAAKWVAPGEVAAAAVNSIHIKTGSIETERTIFSILPKEFILPPKKYRSFLSPNSSIYTDIKAGTSIFGGGFSPFVGNVVMLSEWGKKKVQLPEKYVPKVGDEFYIIVTRPKRLPKEIIFENRFGGAITIRYYSGDRRVIGEVLRPVSGVGRFEGSRYVDPGRIRANHAGVIDISVSPKGSLGGFQIVPALHGQNMNYVKKMTQWMVIGPKDVTDPSLEGIAPFFRGYIHPQYSADDLEAKDWEEKLLSRYLVEVRYDGEDTWGPMPIYSLKRRWPLPKWSNSVFDYVSHFRIFFPIEEK
ncbi:MAG: hypothetical protein U9R38_01685 [Candidatus Margulisiibacteriota bacterium]|nr:hypothetical protein [Candidatus Margulisiibacteriota bacterium]